MSVLHAENGVRPMIRLEYVTRDEYSPVKGAITNCGVKSRIILTKEWISVDCTDITPEALEYILNSWKSSFKQQERKIKLQ
jgi:hypothetical protein